MNQLLRRAHSYALTLIVACTILSASTALGQSNIRFATERYDAGVENYDAGNYGAALKEFEASYSLYGSPNTRLYIARTLRELGRYAEAAEAFTVTEREGKDRARQDPRYKQAAEAARTEGAALRKRLGHLMITVDESAPDDLQIEVNGKRIPREAAMLPIWVKAGRIEVVFRLNSEPVDTHSVTVPPEGTVNVSPKFSFAEEGHDETESTSRVSSSSPTSILGWASVGLGAASAITSGVFFVLTGNKHSEVAECDANPRCAASTYRDDLAGSGDDLQLGAFLLAGASVVSMAIGVILLITHESEIDFDKEEAVSVRTDGRSAYMRFTF